MCPEASSLRTLTEFSRLHFRPSCATPHYDASQRAPHVSSSVPTRSTRQYASVPIPCLRDRRIERGWSVPPATRCARVPDPDPQICRGSDRVGVCGLSSLRLGRTSTPRARHRRTTMATSHPTTKAAPPARTKRRALGPDDTPCAPSGQDQTCPVPVAAGTPVRPPRGSFVRPNRAARDRPERGGPSGGRMTTLNSLWTPRRTLSPRRGHTPRSSRPAQYGTDDGRVTGFRRRDDHIIDAEGLTVAVGVQLGVATAVHRDRRRQRRLATAIEIGGWVPGQILPNRIARPCHRAVGTPNRRQMTRKARSRIPCSGPPVARRNGSRCWPNQVRAARPTRERTRAPSASRHHQHH